MKLLLLQESRLYVCICVLSTKCRRVEQFLLILAQKIDKLTQYLWKQTFAGPLAKGVLDPELLAPGGDPLPPSLYHVFQNYPISQHWLHWFHFGPLLGPPLGPLLGPSLGPLLGPLWAPFGGSL